MARNENLKKSKMSKNDEWYTRYEDIDDELYYYTNDREDLKIHNQFKDKVVLLNCDDPEWSNFYKYFDQGFTRIGLKKLISTHYEADGSPSYALIKEKVGDNIECRIQKLKGNGDFRSDECIEFLKECDIVCTNPPFSLIREFLDILNANEKYFLIIGPANACHYKNFFPFIKRGVVSFGYNFANGAMSFRTPDNKIVPQHSYWYTNMDVSKFRDFLELPDSYYEDETKYIKYHNLDAINVDRIDDIPGDYDGIIGAPDSVLSKISTAQFEILGTQLSEYADELGTREIGQEWVDIYRANGGTGHITKGMRNPVLIINGKAKSPYSRIFIRNRNPRPRKEDK